MLKHEIKEVMLLSLDTIRSNKLRSFLTILGVVIGVMTVIGMASVIEGLNRSFAQQLSAMGSSTIFVSRFPTIQFGRLTQQQRMRKELSYDDAMAIKADCPSVSAVSPMAFPGFITSPARYGSEKANGVMVRGVVADFLYVFDSPLDQGRFITDTDVEHRTNVVVLGSEIVEKLFPSLDPLGKTIMWDGQEYLVVGTLQKLGSFLGQDRDNRMLIPFSTIRKYYPERKDTFIAVKPSSQEQMQTAIDQIIDAMRRQRRVRPDQENNFEVGTQDQIADLYNKVTGGAYMVMLVISSIGLLVGGIGVMNIMLVSVTERTREIGVRKAIGARRKDILWQFLLEAMVLTGVGGILGIVIGAGISWLVNKYSPLPSAVSAVWITLAFSVSVSVGLFFGLYPANKAAKLNPIDALRYE
ncbi:MAG: ABC transporter permease [Acidobacteriia bacterium]|nr:ABC transporter permease [Terriglobia bacterium]